MNAEEAKQKSREIEEERRKKSQEEYQKQKEAKERKRIADNKNFVKKFEALVRKDIQYAVNAGRTNTKITLSENGENYMVSWFYDTEYMSSKWMAEDETRQYLGKSRFGKQIETVIKRLQKDKFKVEVYYTSVKHDETAAYLNSGGECGSREPYWTNNNIMEISW